MFWLKLNVKLRIWWFSYVFNEFRKRKSQKTRNHIFPCMSCLHIHAQTFIPACKSICQNAFNSCQNFCMSVYRLTCLSPCTHAYTSQHIYILVYVLTYFQICLHIPIVLHMLSCLHIFIMFIYCDIPAHTPMLILNIPGVLAGFVC